MIIRNKYATGFLLLAVVLFSRAAVAQQPQLILPAGHTNLVSGVYFSPDGKLVITNGEEEKNIKIWETRTGKLLKTIDAHTERITSVSFSSDGRYFMTTGHDQHAYIWDAASLEVYYKIYYRFNNWIENGFFSRDGKRVLLVSQNMMEYHDVPGKKFLRPVMDSSLLGVADREMVDREQIASSSLSPDGNRAVTAHYDSSIRTWDLVNGRIIHKIKSKHGLFYSVVFSSSGNQFLACGPDGSLNVWDTRSGNLIRSITKKGFLFINAVFSPNEQQILTCTLDTANKKATAELWNIPGGQLLKTFDAGPGILTFSAVFNSRGSSLLTMSDDGSIRLWEVSTGKLIREVAAMEPRVKKMLPRLEENGFKYVNANFSEDGLMIAAAAINNVAAVQETVSGKMISKLGVIASVIYEPRFSKDGEMLATAGFRESIDVSSNLEGIVSLWDLREGKLLRKLSGHTGPVLDICFSNDDTQLATVSADSTARIWDLSTGKTLHVFRGHEKEVHQCFLTHDAKYLVTKTFSGQARIWDIENEKMIAIIRHDSAGPDNNRFGIYNLRPSSTGKFLFVDYYDDDGLVQIAETATGRILYTFNTKKDSVGSIQFDPAEKNLVYRKGSTIHVMDILSGKNLPFIPSPAKLKRVILGHKGELVAMATPDSVFFRSVHSGDLLSGFPLSGKKVDYGQMEFTEDDRYFVVFNYDSSVRVWDVRTAEPVRKINLTADEYFLFTLTRENRHFVFTRAMDNILRIRDLSSGALVTSVLDKFTSTLVYKFHPEKARFVLDNKFTSDIIDIGYSAPTLKIIPAPGNSYLVTDSAGHYDGTEDARKSLYFTCGTEIVELDQVKDLLWVPGLAKRVMNRETIHAPGIASLEICSLTPKLEEAGSKAGEYLFRIKPRRGGLGETVLYVNGIEAQRYKPVQLKKSGEWYELLVKREALQSFFIPGQENLVTAKAFTADNSFSSRGAVVSSREEQKPATAPNLYAVMIGVSDYKGSELDLKYAAKDATDIANAVSVSARKLLNSDGKEHVFIYNLNTSKERDQLPEKNAVKKVLEEIGSKATASDVILIFFAGHGVMAGEADKKQFYFLTADASTLASTAAVKDVGISTTELTEWMKPQNIKAQKRILVFDACNSGQAIKDFVKMGGNDQQYVAARSDDKSQLVKAIDKLNEKSGLFILSASASDQSAYEMGRYSQGLLTYSLLKAIKEQPDILEDGKYLNVSRWFNAAEKTVNELAKETGARQEPQIVSTTNFNIGIVDEDVMAKIVLPQEKPLFAASNFQNSDEAIADDDLELSKMVNLQLNDMATRGAESKIVYVTATHSPDAWTLSGRYTVSGTAITAQVNIKQSKAIKHRFEINGTTDKLKELAAAITKKAAGMVK